MPKTIPPNHVLMFQRLPGNEDNDIDPDPSRNLALRDIIREAMSALPDHPHPDLVIGALAHMVWMARTDLVDLKRKLAECTG